ncbi:hypothetical protein SB719_22660, partial [Pantoea sp. SIMBA_079]|uniref:hypothetical protein n=1 Tax=Pantoea sp. SIMBA_079 TaxID=3085817 RepID=UPI00399474F0
VDELPPGVCFQQLGTIADPIVVIPSKFSLQGNVVIGIQSVVNVVGEALQILLSVALQFDLTQA